MRNRFLFLVVFILTLIASTVGTAQTPVTQTFPFATIKTAPPRMGANMAGCSYYDAEIMKNLLSCNNSGWEPGQYASNFASNQAGTTTLFWSSDSFELSNQMNGNNGKGINGFNYWSGANIRVVHSQSGNTTGYTGTITGNTGSISVISATFSGSSSPFTITATVDSNPVTAGFAVGQQINWEFSNNSSYVNSFACCTITALTSSTVSWRQTSTPTGTAQGGFLGTNVTKSYTVSPAASASFGVGDAIIISKTFSPTPSVTIENLGNGTWGGHSGTGANFGATTAGGYTLCSTCGSQSLGLSVSASGDNADGQIYFDAPAGAADRFTNLNGTYSVSVDAVSSSGTITPISLTASRDGTGTNCNWTITPTTSWATYTHSCTFTETATTANGAANLKANLAFNTAPNTVLLDNWDLHKTSGVDSTNTSAFTDGYISLLRDFYGISTTGTNECTIRNWTNQNSQSFASWSAIHGKGNYTSGILLYDFLQATEMLGCNPYLELPTTLSAADAALVMEFINGSSSTTGGAARAANGHASPFNFTNIYMSYCNECWNNSFTNQNWPSRNSVPPASCSGSFEYYYDYSFAMAPVYAAIRGDASYDASKVHLGFNGQTGVTQSVGSDCSTATGKPDFWELQNYKQSVVADPTAPNIYKSILTEPFVLANLVAAPNDMLASSKYLQTINKCGASASSACFVNIYETGNSTWETCNVGGTPACSGTSSPPVAITQTQSDSVTAGRVQSIPENIGHMEDMRSTTANIRSSNIFASVEYSNGAVTPGIEIKLWGFGVDQGGAMSFFNNLAHVDRPSGLGGTLLNNAIDNGNWVSCPFNTPPLENWAGNRFNGTAVTTGYGATGGTPAYNGVPLLYSYCFYDGTNVGILYINTEVVSNTNYTVNFSGSNGPQGVVTVKTFPLTTNPGVLCESPTGSITNTTTACQISTATTTSPSSITIPPGQTFIKYALGGLPTAVQPSFSPVGGTYSSTQTVTLSTTTPSPTMYYTTDGSTPTTSSTVYTTPLSVSTSETIKAITVASGFNNSPVSSASYVITIPTVALPTFSPVGGTYTGAQTVTISDSTGGATIHYTTDGSTPTSGSMVYTVPLTVSSNETIKALAILAGHTNSPVATAIYVINFGFSVNCTIVGASTSVGAQQIQ